MNVKNWEELQREAQRVLDELMTELPPDLRKEALRVPCLFQTFDAEDSELLGIYHEFSSGEISAAKGPIVLYLAAIELYCRDEELNFKDEVRQTYLHELGHHLGWDEGDLEARGME